jgi:hypothetical protein
MSTPNSWPGSSGMATASPATAVKAVRGALATRRCMSPSTSPPAWSMSRYFRTSRRPRLSASWLGLSAGSACRESPAGASSQTTALPTARVTSAKPARPSISSRSAPSRIRPAPTARPSGSSRPFAGNGPMRCHSRPPRSGSGGFLAPWGSITDAAATWPTVASALSSAWSLGSLHDLVRKHT